jgi:hypothetical protein
VCGWSNSNLKAILGAIESAFTGGTMSKADYVTGVYSKLLTLQQDQRAGIDHDGAARLRQHAHQRADGEAGSDAHRRSCSSRRAFAR